MKSGSLNMPPDYGTQAYWDDRFRRDTKPFDWLLPADCLDAAVSQAIAGIEQPRLLHIGCGSSDTSFQLRQLVDAPEQITNMDYSTTAIEQCRQREREELGEEGGAGMVWEVADLLSAESLTALVSSSRHFDVVVDKSTCDCIACTEDVDIQLPYRLPGDIADGEAGAETCRAKIHPLHLLAVNLAAMTRSGSGRWVVLSFSDDRFPFLRDGCGTMRSGTIYPGLLGEGVADPARLWRLERRERLVAEESKVTGGQGSGVVYRPETAYWLYVLARTEVEL
jgi:EEF1A lysine methyltransferase 4